MKVTVVLPPQAARALLCCYWSERRCNRLAVAEASHDANWAFTAACVWQVAAEVFTGQFNTTGDQATVNVAWQVVVSGAQVLVKVKVTVVLPPQADGAPVLLFVKTPLQPPLAVAVPAKLQIVNSQLFVFGKMPQSYLSDN